MKWFQKLVCVLLIVWMTMLSFPLPLSAQITAYRSVQTDTMRIALTFDDGPHPFLTKRILDILDRYEVKATFFMVGENIRNYPDAAREVILRGHEVGNHTDSHDHMTRLNEHAVMREVSGCEAALEELCEYRPHLFRPPEGAVTPYVQSCLENEDYMLVLWSLDTRDWEEKSTERIVRTVLGQVRAGDIILMHDYIGRNSKTPEALEILLPQLLERGYEFVTVSTLLSDIGSKP